MARLSQVQRERAVGMLLAGRSIAEVARTFACTRPTIYMLQRRLRQTGTTSDRPRSGRPKVTTTREDRMIRLAHLRNRFLPNQGDLSAHVQCGDGSDSSALGPEDHMWVLYSLGDTRKSVCVVDRVGLAQSVAFPPLAR